MRVLIDLMIFAGSALMVDNIVRYTLFVRTSTRLERQNRKNGLLIVPLLLLIFFLVGYLTIGLSGIADWMVASILLGGSIFVYLLLRVMFSIIARVRDTDQVLSARYDEMKAELESLTRDSHAVFRVNLTRDEVEERAGDYLYDSDLEHDRYTDLLAARSQYVLDPSYAGTDRALFTRDGLLRHYQDGQTFASEVLLVRQRDGTAAFVRIEASLTKKPISGDVIAFITERPYNVEVVRQTLMESVLMDQYDRIAYLVDGEYHVLISNDGKKAGLLLPADTEERYESLYLNYILPAMTWDPDRDGANPLRLSVIDRALAVQPVYHVDAPFRIGGESRQKHFVFYPIDRAAKFYLLLLSDSGQAQDAPAAPEQAPAPAGKASTDVPEAVPAAPAAASGPAPTAPGRELHLLLVDDNEINREIGELTLTGEGFTVETACDGAEAVDKVASAAPGTYDAVLMDIQMPVLNGYEATRRIRALPDAERADVPIIALTASIFPEDVSKALAAGMDGCASKPIILPELLKAIDNALADHGKEA